MSSRSSTPAKRFFLVHNLPVCLLHFFKFRFGLRFVWIIDIGVRVVFPA